MEKSVSSITYLLRSFVTGFIVAAGLALCFYYGILLTYRYFPGPSVMMLGLIMVFSLLLWINIKCDHMLDLNDVFSKTISFDMKNRAGLAGFFLRYLRPFSPYIGVVIAFIFIVLVLWSVPALIMYLFVYPGPPGKLLNISVYCLSTGVCLLFYYANRDAFRSGRDKFMFIAGILCGAAALLKFM